MKIDPTTTVNIPDIQGQNGLQANNKPDMSIQDNAKKGNIAYVNQTSQKQTQSSTNDPLQQSVLGTKGVIALDDDKNVVIRFFDSTGKMVAQYPPEDYLNMMKELNQETESLFHVKA
jgi:uncharacterized FlaG/YvyC family protein